MRLTHKDRAIKKAPDGLMPETAAATAAATTALASATSDVRVHDNASYGAVPATAAAETGAEYLGGTNLVGGAWVCV